jgi:hypothetical protein
MCWPFQAQEPLWHAKAEEWPSEARLGVSFGLLRLQSRRMAKLFAPAVVSAPAAAAPPQRLLDLSHEHSERTPQFMGEFDAACGLAAVARGGGWGQAARWEVIASLGPLLCPRPRPFVASSAARGPRRPSAPKP